MTFKYRALTLGCFASHGFGWHSASGASRGRVARSLRQPLSTIPNWTFGDSSATGSAVSTMTGGKTGAQTNTFKAGAVSSNKIIPVNSYIGFKGKKL
jgi:hypothetical protein